MQTYLQTFAGPTTWEMNVSGTYFTTLQCTNPVNVRLYKGGQLLDLGSINGLLAGLEVFEVEFDRVQIDITGADVVQIGIGKGNARYNRQNAAVAVTSSKQSISAAFANSQKTVTNASAQLIAANTARQYMLIQNNDNAGIVYIGFGATAVTALTGVKILPGGSYEMPATQNSQALQAIGSIASNANIILVEG